MSLLLLVFKMCGIPISDVPGTYPQVRNAEYLRQFFDNRKYILVPAKYWLYRRVLTPSTSVKFNNRRSCWALIGGHNNL